MELLHKIEKYARELGYDFLIRVDDEEGDWFVHFCKYEPIEYKYEGHTKTKTLTDDFACVYTNVLEDTLKWLIDRIENELIKES
jgi:hypothetical protein